MTSPTVGRGYGHVTVLNYAVCRDAAHRVVLSATAELFVKFCPSHFFVIGEATHYSQKKCVQCHVASKFWEVSDNILLMVQDRDIVAMED